MTALTFKGGVRKINLRNEDVLVIESENAITPETHQLMVDQVKRFGERRGIKLGALILDNGVKLRAVLREGKTAKLKVGRGE